MGSFNGKERKSGGNRGAVVFGVLVLFVFNLRVFAGVCSAEDAFARRIVGSNGNISVRLFFSDEERTDLRISRGDDVLFASGETVGSDALFRSAADSFSRRFMVPDGGLTADALFRTLLDASKGETERAGGGASVFAEFSMKEKIDEELLISARRMRENGAAVDSFFEREAFIATSKKHLSKSMSAWKIENAEWKSERYAKALWSAHRESGVDPFLIVSVLVAESGGRADAVSPAGAVGLMQVHARVHMRWIPDWYDDISTVDDLFVPEKNIRVGATILASRLGDSGDERRALYAYRGGKSSSYAESILRNAKKLRKEADETLKKERGTFPAGDEGTPVRTVEKNFRC